MVAKLRAHQISRCKKGTETHKSGVTHIFQIIPDTAPMLSGHKGASVDGSRGHSDHSVKCQIMLHKYVQYAGCVDASHGSAFQYKTFFHIIHRP